MTKLQQLIRKEIMAGEDFASIGRKSGINHVSIGQYDKGVTPNGKNLAKLSRYFLVSIEDLVEPVNTSTNQNTADDMADAVIARMSERRLVIKADNPDTLDLSSATPAQREAILFLMRMPLAEQTKACDLLKLVWNVE